MWIFTKYGFFSAVCARQGDGSHSQPTDPDRIMVRARVRGHLEQLKSKFPEVLSESGIQVSKSTDYAYRMFIPKSVWVEVISALAEETDYDNFKSEVAKYEGRTGAEYEHALHAVWDVMHRLQK
jgi:hypothetical protein